MIPTEEDRQAVALKLNRKFRKVVSEEIQKSVHGSRKFNAKRERTLVVLTEIHQRLVNRELDAIVG